MDEETNAGGGPGNSLLTWVAPLLILLVMIIFGAWFCRTKPAPPKPEEPKPANVNTANANSANSNSTAVSNTANANSANGNSTAVSNSGNSAPSGNSNKYR